MNKIEQMWNILCTKQKEIIDAIETHKMWNDTMNVNHELGKTDLVNLHLRTQLDIVEKIISEYKFLYSDELDVIIGNCMEFKVR